MTGYPLTRRRFAVGAASLLAAPALLGGRARAANAKVTIVGGGFGGASVARYLKRHRPELAVTLIEPEAQFTTCPFSNGVLGGLWPQSTITFNYEGLRRAGVAVVQDAAVSIDVENRQVKLRSEASIPHDFLVISPGIAFDTSRIDGYDATAVEAMPHAWKAGRQTELLRGKLEAMADGGLVIVAVPPPPFRCPPGPYERASLIAAYLKAQKPRSKILILDATENFSKQQLFEEAWKALYPGMIERVPASASGRVVRVDAKSGTVSTEFDDFSPDVANIIPPQTAGRIAIDAGLDDEKGFCPVNPVTFESTINAGVYVIGDAAIAGAMPKSGFAANNQAKACGAALLAAMDGLEPAPSKLINVCYSFAAIDYAFSVADVYQPTKDGLTAMYKDNRTTPLATDAATHAAEAEAARGWFQSITTEMFG